MPNRSDREVIQWFATHRLEGSDLIHCLSVLRGERRSLEGIEPSEQGEPSDFDRFMEWYGDGCRLDWWMVQRGMIVESSGREVLCLTDGTEEGFVGMGADGTRLCRDARYADIYARAEFVSWLKERYGSKPAYLLLGMSADEEEDYE